MSTTSAKVLPDDVAMMPQVIVAKLDALQIALPGEPHFFVRECAALWLQGEGDRPHYFHGATGAKQILRWGLHTCPDDYLVLGMTLFFRAAVEAAVVEGGCVTISVAGIAAAWTFAGTPEAVRAVQAWQSESRVPHPVLAEVVCRAHD